MKVLWKGGILVGEKEAKKADLLAEDGIIIKISDEIQPEEAEEVHDVSGKWLFPGFIDAHTHFALEVAGTVTADDFYTGTKAALAGGTTCIIDFATQYKGESLHRALSNWHQKADKKSSCHYAFHLAISDWRKEISEELQSIADEGVTSFKLYMTYDDMKVSDQQMYEILRRLKEVGAIAGVHCENDGIIKARIAEEKQKGNLGADTHPKTRPSQAEAEAVQRLLRIAELVETPVIIVHLSSKEGMEEVRRARARGQKVYVESCPQYLLLNQKQYEKEAATARSYVCSPPLRTTEDQEVLWNALQRNEIQTISTDHCSFTKEQKAAGSDDFTKIPNGMPGVENRPVLIFSEGVVTGKISKEQMCCELSANPAKLYGLYPKKGVLAEGSDADIVVWDPKKQWTIQGEFQNSISDAEPYEGKQVVGCASEVYLNGLLCARDGKVVREKQGIYLKRKKLMHI